MWQWCPAAAAMAAAAAAGCMPAATAAAVAAVTAAPSGGEGPSLQLWAGMISLDSNPSLLLQQHGCSNLQCGRNSRQRTFDTLTWQLHTNMATSKENKDTSALERSADMFRRQPRKQPHWYAGMAMQLPLVYLQTHACLHAVLPVARNTGSMPLYSDAYVCQHQGMQNTLTKAQPCAVTMLPNPVQ